jgi:hypothetical protein
MNKNDLRNELISSLILLDLGAIFSFIELAIRSVGLEYQVYLILFITSIFFLFHVIQTERIRSKYKNPINIDCICQN